jgi:ferredoxin
MRVIVDYDLCDSHGECMTAAPEVFEVRDDDLLYVLDERPADGLRPKIEAAARRCPKLAIVVADD